MKNRFNLFAGLLLAVAAIAPLKAHAQFDFYGQPRCFILASETILTNNSGTLNASNAPIDIHGYDGIAAVLFSATNVAGSGGSPTLYARLEGSADGTNWYLMTNVSKATATTYNVTNINGGHIETNTFLLPGTITTPVAATAGTAQPYLVPEPFTNNAVLCTNVTGVVAQFGLDVQNCPRYVHVAYTVTGTAVAFSSSAFVVARKNRGDFFY